MNKNRRKIYFLPPSWGHFLLSKKDHMKNISNFIILCLVSFNAYATQAESIRVNNEIKDEHRGAGISIVFKQWNRNSLPVTYGGLSINTLKSNFPLEKENRNQIYPVYVFMGITLNYPISPFLELGMDLGDALEDKIFEGDFLEVDIYYSYGLTITYKKAFDLSLYHKTYDLYFSEFADTRIQNANIDITGISISFYLK